MCSIVVVVDCVFMVVWFVWFSALLVAAHSDFVFCGFVDAGARWVDWRYCYDLCLVLCLRCGLCVW